MRDTHRGWQQRIPSGGAAEWDQNPGHARRDPGGCCFGRGFNSRRLHQAERAPSRRHNGRGARL